MQHLCKFQLRGNDFDLNGRLLPSAILDMFQEAAGQHAEILGCGFENFSKKGLLWVIVRSKFEVIKSPEVHSTVFVKTWPLPPTRLSYRRDYLMADENGDVLIKATSDWVVIDSNTRSFAKADMVYPENEEYITDLSIQEKLKKLHTPEMTGQAFVVTPSYCDIDRNGHVNNTKYAEYVLNALNPECINIKSFQIDYHKEVLKGEPLYIKVANDEKNSFASGTNQEGNTMFVCKIETE